MIFIKTDRLILRQWIDSDREVFADLNADPEVLKYFPNTLSREQSDALVDRITSEIKENGYGLFACELIDTQEFIGFIGLNSPNYETPFTPCVEIGWRLHKKFWRKGYATEGARACLDFAFYQLGLGEVVSFCTASNLPSYSVMEKIGMTTDPKDNFDHPLVDKDSPLLPHVLYRLTKADYLQTQK